MEILKDEIENIAQELSTAIGNRLQQHIYPGPNTKQLYTQIVQQQDLERYDIIEEI